MACVAHLRCICVAFTIQIICVYAGGMVAGFSSSQAPVFFSAVHVPGFLPTLQEEEDEMILRLVDGSLMDSSSLFNNSFIVEGISMDPSLLSSMYLNYSQGQNLLPRFWQPQKMEPMPYHKDIVLVADTYNHAIRIVNFARRETSTLVPTIAQDQSTGDVQASYNQCLNVTNSSSPGSCSFAAASNFLESLLMPYSLAIHPHQTHVFVADTRGQAIRMVSIFSKEMTTVFSKLPDLPVDLMWISEKTLIVLLANNQLYSAQFNSSSLQVEKQLSLLLLSNATLQDGRFANAGQLLSMAYNPAGRVLKNISGGEILVSDFHSKVIHSIDLSTGLVSVAAGSLWQVAANSSQEPPPLPSMRDNDPINTTDTAISSLLAGPTMLYYMQRKLYFTDRLVESRTSAIRMWDMLADKVSTISPLMTSISAWGLVVPHVNLSIWADASSGAILSTSQHFDTSIQTGAIPCSIGSFFSSSSMKCMKCSNHTKPEHVDFLTGGSALYPDTLQCSWECTSLYNGMQQPFLCRGVEASIPRPEFSKWGILSASGKLVHICNEGYFRNHTGTCSVCTANSYCSGLDYNFTGLQACPPNSNSPSGAVSVDQCICNRGYIGPNGGQCLLCPPGNICLGGNTTSVCPLNTALVDTAVLLTTFNFSSCKPVAGFYQITQGSAGLRCPYGFYCPGGGGGGSGGLVLTNQTQFIFACPSHSNTSAMGSTSIHQCACKEGYFFSNASLLCLPCPKGSYCIGGSSQHTACPHNLTTAGNGTASIEGCTCPNALPMGASYMYAAGQVHHNATRPCFWRCTQSGFRRVGHFFSDANASCRLCKQPSTHGACPVGMYYAGCNADEDGILDASCSMCTNAFADGNGLQYLTPGSQQNFVGVNDCQWQCAVGFFVDLANQRCKQCTARFCAAGFYRETCYTANRTAGEGEAGCLVCTPEAPEYGFLARANISTTNSCGLRCYTGWWPLQSIWKCCSDNAILGRNGDCVCSAGFQYPSEELNGIVCTL